MGWGISYLQRKIEFGRRVVSCRVPSASARSHPGRTEPGAVILIEARSVQLSDMIFRMTITRSISQLLGKARNMKRLVRKRTHAVEHEAWKLALNSRELKESHKRIAFMQQHQLQQQQHVQKLLANGLRLLQLEHELKHLEEEDEVLDKQENQLQV